MREFFPSSILDSRSSSTAAASRIGLLPVLAGLIALCGCTSGNRINHTGQPSPPPAWIWPADEPESPRTIYLQSIARPSDAGVRISGIGRFGRWLMGSGKGEDSLVKPLGIALDENDNLCVTDTGANALYFLDRAKKKWNRWDRFGKLRFSSPVGVAKRNALLYVADSGLASVLAFGENGKLLLQITNRLERPSGVALVGGRLFVTDSKRHCVVSFDPLGHYLSEFGRRGFGPGEFNFPTHITADLQGDLYVTDSMNSRIQILDAEGKFKSQIGSAGDSTGHFSRPKGVAVDSFGHIFVIDALFDNIQVFDRAGQFLMSLGESGTQPGQFWLPNGIAISRSNEIFVADSYNHRVQVFKYVGPP